MTKEQRIQQLEVENRELKKQVKRLELDQKSLAGAMGEHATVMVKMVMALDYLQKQGLVPNVDKLVLDGIDAAKAEALQKGPQEVDPGATQEVPSGPGKSAVEVDSGNSGSELPGSSGVGEPAPSNEVGDKPEPIANSTGL
jgi:hypothetical protein